jgi:hypothetical protein
MEQHVPSQQWLFFYFFLIAVIAFEQWPIFMELIIGHHPEESEGRTLN